MKLLKQVVRKPKKAITPKEFQERHPLVQAKPITNIYIPPTEKSKETKEALEWFQKSKNFYVIAEIKGRPNHVALNDVVVTNKMNDLNLGDVISLDRIREIGSESGVLKGNPYVSPNYFRVTASVISHTLAKPITRKHSKKSGLSKYVTNQSHHTLLRINEISIKK
jgi:ribosomal protein L21